MVPFLHLTGYSIFELLLFFDIHEIATLWSQRKMFLMSTLVLIIGACCQCDQLYFLYASFLNNICFPWNFLTFTRYPVVISEEGVLDKFFSFGSGGKLSMPPLIVYLCFFCWMIFSFFAYLPSFCVNCESSNVNLFKDDGESIFHGIRWN